MTTASESDPQKLRGDAARNRQRLLQAARQIADEGQALQFNQVARRAEVGVGTVYRHFATPEALLETLVMPRFEGLLAAARDIVAIEDNWLALTTFLAEAVKAQLSDRGFASVVEAPNNALPQTLRLKAALGEIFETLLAASLQAGSIRSDVTSADINALLCGLSHSIRLRSGQAADDPKYLQRYVDILVSGLKRPPEPAS